MHKQEITDIGQQKMWINCKEATQLMMIHECDKLVLRQRIALWIHMIVCKLCRLFAKQSKEINELLKKDQSTKNVSLSFEKKEQLTQFIHELQSKGV